MLELINVARVYKSGKSKVSALSDISIKLPNNGLVALVGENGCGKTTLLNLISTVDNNYKGKILYNSHDYREITSVLRRNIVSYVFQENMFISKFTVADNIEVFADNPNDINIELEKFDILEKRAELPTHLSGGQKQRTSLIRGLLNDSEILLVDEPTSAMNEEMERQVFERLKALATNKLVILVSHNLDLIKQFADLIIHMDKGCIICSESNSADAIRYEDNYIFVPRDFENLVALDKAFIKQKLSEKNEVHLKIAENTPDVQKLDYSVRSDLPQTSPSRLKRQTRQKLAKRFCRINVVMKIFIILGIALLTSFFALLLSLEEFDGNEFAYKFLKQNTDDLIPYEEQIQNILSEKGFSYKIGTEIQEHYTNNLINVRYFAEGLSLGYLMDDFYSDSIDGIAFYNDVDYLPLDYGKYPQQGECLITDYLASSICSFSKETSYKDYKDIIEQGINAGGLHFDISGIIRTDYKSYITKYDPVFPVAELENKIKYYYCNVYCPQSDLLANGLIPVCYDGNDNIFYAIKPDDTDLQHVKTLSSEWENQMEKLNIADKPKIYINMAMANKVEPENLFFYFENQYGEEFYIIEGLVEDESLFPTVYIPTCEINDFVTKYLDSITNILAENTSPQLIEFLEHYSMANVSAYAETINLMKSMVSYSLSVVEKMKVVTATFFGLLIVVFVLLILREDRLPIAFLRMQDVAPFDIYGFEASKIVICSLLSAAISAVAMLSEKRIINKFFSDKEHANVPLVSISFENGLLSILLMFGFMVVISIVIIIIHKHKRIDSLLNQ